MSVTAADSMMEPDDNDNESVSKNQSFAQQSAQDGGSSASKHSRRLSGSVVDDDGSVASSWAPPPSPGQRAEPTRLTPQRQTLQATEQQHPLSQDTPQEKSRQQDQKTRLQDQVLAGTLELLKMAGGVTLSTTGKLVSPPLHVTRTILLPALWNALVEYVHQVTPMRVKDWFRILSSSVHHIFTVIGRTQKGKIFQEKMRTVGGGLFDCVTNDVSRQALVDGMASLVKLSEALHTPETKALLEQLSVLACRLVDVAASGRNKKLLHDVSDAAWAGLELVSDPSCTLALAEVTAYLCYALEMEDALYREVPMDKQRAAQRRYQRNAYQKQTYVDPNLTTDANSTVEQVILSSIGETGEEGSYPSNVILRQGESATNSEKDWLHSEAEEQNEGLNWTERARDDIDLSLLNERISMRASELQRQREAQKKPVDTSFSQPKQKQTHDRRGQSVQQSVRRVDDMEEIIVRTVDENDNHVEYVEETLEAEQPETADTKSKKRDLEYEQNRETAKKENDEIDEWLSEHGDLPPVATVDGESALGRFYRRLDEITSKKRAEAVTDILNRQAHGKLSWFPKAAAAAGAGNERGQDTIKNRVAAIRAQIGVGQETKLVSKQRPISVGECIFGLLAVVWFVLGLYGFSVLLSAGWTTFTVRSNVRQEVLVRIVREVVHVGPDGNVIKMNQYKPLYEKNVDDVAACVAKAME